MSLDVHCSRNLYLLKQVCLEFPKSTSLLSYSTSWNTVSPSNSTADRAQWDILSNSHAPPKVCVLSEKPNVDGANGDNVPSNPCILLKNPTAQGAKGDNFILLKTPTEDGAKWDNLSPKYRPSCLRPQLQMEQRKFHYIDKAS